MANGNSHTRLIDENSHVGIRGYITNQGDQMMNCLVQIGEEYFKSLHIDTAFGGKGVVKLNTNPNIATAMIFTDYSQAAALVSLVTSLKTYENEVIKIVPEF